MSVRHLFTLALVVLASACAPRYRHLTTRALATPDALACNGFLVWNAEPVRDVFLVINGSGTLSNAFVNPAFDDVMRTQPIAYATWDKPGVIAPFGDPAAVKRDDATIERYTLGHGVECATQALGWVRERFGPGTRVHVRAHSEGTLVALYTYDALLARGDGLAGMIDTFVFSGLGLEPFDVIVEHQLSVIPDGARLKAAFASCDWPLLKERMGISCAYLADAVKRPSGRAVFENLAARAAPARFYVFQGTTDWNTRVEPVRALEAWNASAGHLALELRYYEGGHGGSEAARAEISRLLATLVTR